MRETKFTRRATALFLSVAMLFTMSGSPVYAVSGGKDTGTTGLCEHHPAHTADCGYVEAQPGTPCSHEHTEECYRLVEKCVHEHTAECYPEEDDSEDDATPSNAKALETAECSHECSEDTGCITKVLDCPHEHEVNGGETDREGGLGRDEDCGYTKGTEGSPCTYVCDICNAADSGKQENPEPKECVCKEACTEESINGDCPVCGAEGADLSECKGIKAGLDEAMEKVITAWEWVDLDGRLVDGGLALPGVNEENQADFDTVVSMLPEEIKATVTGAEEPETIALAGWTCNTFVQDENGDWPVTGTYDFIAELPEGYGLGKGVDLLEVAVTLGSANLLTGETTIDGLTFQGADLSGITRQNDGQIVIGAGGDCTISGTWSGRVTGATSYTTKSAILIDKDVSVNITLSGVDIDASKTNYVAAFQIANDSTGTVNITLAGDNTLKSGTACAGLQKNGAGESIGKLTIKGGGTLTATGGQNGAGIGGGTDGPGSDITIRGGTVTATGGDYGAGIGGGFSGAGSDITISSGTVTATGGDYGAGIGGGGSGGTGSNIIISGGTVTAMGGSSGAGIGGGSVRAGSDITISGGTVIATGGNYGAGIGGGSDKAGSNITISGGTVTATGGQRGAGIGGGYKGAGSDITISGGEVNATSSDGGAGIGGGYKGAGSKITISGDTVNATGGDYGAGIGGGYDGTGSDITISGGTVNASGGSYGAGIGGGYDGTGSTGNQLDGSAVVFATCGQNATDHIQGFDGGLTSGVLFGGDTGTVYGSPTIAANVTIEAGKTLTIPSGKTLTIGTGVTLMNNGTITNNGTIANDGFINNRGTIGGDGKITGNPLSVPSQVTGLTFVKDGNAVDNATIGETVSLRVTVEKATTKSRMAALDQVIFKLGNTTLATAPVTGGTATSTPFTLSFEQGWQLGKNSLTVEYGGGGGLLDSTSTAPLTINGITGGGITITSDDGNATYTEGSGFTLETDGGNYTISGTWDGNITSSTNSNRKSVILVESGVNANITLSNVNIDVSGTPSVAAFQIADDSTGNVSITLVGDNTLQSGSLCAGLQKNGEGENIGKLTIDGDGTLNAIGGSDGAGIGGSSNGSGSDITISGGTVTATGGLEGQGAGIGGGLFAAGSDITISGGTVIARGGDGQGYLYGGTGIGRGGYSVNWVDAPDSTGNQLKENAVVFATHGANTDDHISGFDAGITDCVLFQGNDGKVYGAPTISTDATIPEGKTLTIKTEQTLIIDSRATLTNNGVINCYGTLQGKVNEGTGTINWASESAVTFWKDNQAVTEAEYGDTIEIKVTARKKQGSSLFRSAVKDTADFWLGEIGTGIKLNENQVNVQNNADGTATAVLSLKLSGDKWALGGSTEKDFKITVDFGGSTGAELLESQNSDSVKLKPGSCNIAMSNQSVTYDGTAKEFSSAIVTGTDGESLDNKIIYTYYIDADCTTKTNITNSGAATEGSAPKNVGTYYVKATALAGGNYKETVSDATAALEITKGASTLDGLKTYKDGTQTTEFTYGDTVTVKFTPQVKPALSRMAAPEINQAALFLGTTQLTTPVTATEGSECTLTYTVSSGTPLVIGENTLTVQYGGGNNLNHTMGAAGITLGKKPLTATVDSSDSSATKTYEGSTSFTGVKLMPLGVLAGDTVTATADGTAADADVGENKPFTAVKATLSGADQEYYTLPESSVTGNVAIAPLEASLTWSNVTLTYNGTTQAPTASVSNKIGSDDVAVTVTGGQTNVGSYTATADALTGADAGNYKLPSANTTAFAIEKSSTMLDSLKTYNKDGTQTAAFTYGDTITVKFTPKLQTPATYRMAAPEINQAALFLGTTQLTTPVTATEGSECTLTYTVSSGTPLVIGENTLTVQYGGGNNLNHTMGAAGITLGKKPLTATVDSSDSSATKTYEGSTSFTGVKLMPLGVLAGDTVTATADGTAADADVGENKPFTAVKATLSGADQEYYTLSESSVTGNVTITKALPTYIISTAVSGESGNRKAAVTLHLYGAAQGKTPGGTVTFSVEGLPAQTIGLTDGTAEAVFEGLDDREYTVQAAYSGDDTYKTITANDTFDTTKKEQTGFAVANVGAKTYGDGSFQLSTTGGNGTGAVTYASSDSQIMSISGSTATIHKAGDVTITAAKAGDDTYNAATAVLHLTVRKKAVTFHAENLSVAKGDPMPKFTYVYTPETLPEGDRIVTEPRFSCGAADTNTLGTYDIIISGAVLDNNESYDITYEKGMLIVAERLYTLTVNNAGNGQTEAGQYAPGAEIPVSAGTRSGYTFTGWTSSNGGSFADASQTDTIFTMPEADTTITANWKNNNNGGGNGGNGNNGHGGGGSSSSGGSSGNSGNHSTITPPAGQTTDTPTIGEITIGKQKDGVANIPTGQIESTLKQAQKNAEKNGRKENGVAVSVKLPNGTTSATLDQTALYKLTGAGAKSLTLNFDGASMTFSLDAIKEITKQIAGTVTFSMKPAPLTGDAKNAIGTRPAFDFTVSYQKDGQTIYITNFGKDGISLAIRYTPAAGEQAGSLFAVCGDGGKAEWIIPSSYDQNSKVLRFTAHHLSIYGVGYKTPPAFTDIANHWAKADIDFVVSRGFLSGTSATTFSPDTSMTRCMFVTALGRLAGIDPASYQTRSFSDVKADACYAAYVEWAAKQNIINGTGEGLFSPDTPVTREQMAVIMTNYAGQMGYSIPTTLKENTFTDHSAISAWAAEAVGAMQTAGIITGKDGNRFDPQGSATRAEVAAALRRFVELVIDPATADGWTKNDSGHWLYYKDGKALTGWQTLDAWRYFFNDDGVMHEGWKQEPVSGNWYYWTNDGAVTGWRKIDGKWYYFDQYGIMAVNRKIDDYEVGPDGARKDS